MGEGLIRGEGGGHHGEVQREGLITGEGDGRGLISGGGGAHKAKGLLFYGRKRSHHISSMCIPTSGA